MSGRPVLGHAAVAVVSLLLVSLAFHPTDLWWLGWVGFVPWMAFHERAPRRGTARALMLGYGLHFAWVLMWVGVVAPPLVFLIPLLGMPFVWMLARIADGGVHKLGMPGIVVYPLAIVTTEVLRDQVLGLTWSSVGYTQWRWLEGVQSAAVFRVHLLSFVVLLGNAALARVLLWRLGGGVPGRAAWRGAAVAAGAVLVLHLGGWWRLETVEVEPGPRCVGVQGNIPQVRKAGQSWLGIWRDQHRTWERGGGPTLDPDVLVFAETSLSRVMPPHRGLDYVLRLPLDRSGLTVSSWFPRGRGQHTVLGYVKAEPASPGSPRDVDGDGTEEWNVAGVVENGTELVHEYRKRILVPFGEYIPWSPDWPLFDTLRDAIRDVAGYVPDQNPGTTWGAARLRTRGLDLTYGINICYEAVFPAEWRGLMRDEDPAFVVEISNDGWYGESNELDLVHVATRFRAVECGRSVFRVSNTGISTSVDPCGRYRETVEDGSRRKSVEGLLVDTVPIARGRTAWVRMGDWTCAVFPAALMLLAVRTRARRAVPRVQNPSPPPV